MHRSLHGRGLRTSGGEFVEMTVRVAQLPPELSGRWHAAATIRFEHDGSPGTSAAVGASPQRADDVGTVALFVALQYTGELYDRIERRSVDLQKTSRNGIPQSAADVRA